MKHAPLLTLALGTLLLGACNTGNGSADLQSLLENPLFAERYAEEMVDRMVEYKIQNDPMLEDPAKAAAIEEARTTWLTEGRKARERQREGFMGHIISINEYATGEALYVENTIYLDTTFATVPGPGLHLFLTTVVDPRDVEFPDATAMDIGLLQSPYGAQQYSVEPVSDPQLLRTLVLWDVKLGRLYGFAQLSK